MGQISRDELKKRGFKRFLNSFKFSIQGLKYAYKNEQSMLIHAIVTIIAIALGLLFKISLMEWAVLCLSLGVTLAAELINTAIEAAVDLCTLEIHPLAKIAKDCGSAATFVFSMITQIFIYLLPFLYFTPQPNTSIETINIAIQILALLSSPVFAFVVLSSCKCSSSSGWFSCSFSEFPVTYAFTLVLPA